MREALSNGGRLLGKVLFSALAIAGIFSLALRGPFAASEPPTLAVPAEAEDSGSTRPASAKSAFVIDGLPLGTETFEVTPCDPRTWTPVGASFWTDGSLLLDLERSTGQATAVWTDLADGSAAKTSSDGETAGGAHHAARLTCHGSQRGEVVHTWISGMSDPEALVRRLKEPVTERAGPIPLLAHSRQLLHFRSLDWAIYLDEPSDPSMALDRFRDSMLVRGWSARGRPSTEIATGAPHVPDPEAIGQVLTRENQLCLADRVLVEGRDLLLVACRGLDRSGESRQLSSEEFSP